jgi:septum formation protein
MIKYRYPIYLASKSPRRKKLLKLLNFNVKLVSFQFEEYDNVKLKPYRLVKQLSLEKLEAALIRKRKGIYITADTIVVHGNKVLNKPLDEQDAFKMLSFLSNKTHTVYTGFCVYNSVNNKLINNYEKTQVTFRKLDKDEIWDYIASGSPMDKAGAYGIQDDYGAVFIKKINGCYYNVVGLPLTKVFQSILKVI